MSSIPPTLLWRYIMSAISVLNIVAWILVAAGLLRTSPPDSPQRQVDSTRGWQLLLSSLFVLGCAFRSFLPRIEGLRIGLEDHWIASAMIGRAVATVAVAVDPEFRRGLFDDLPRAPVAILLGGWDERGGSPAAPA